MTVSQAFIFRRVDLISRSDTDDEAIRESVFRFRFADRAGGYFRIAGRKLGISNDVLIADKGIRLERKLFVAERKCGDIQAHRQSEAR